MKRLLALMLVVVMSFSLVACGGNEQQANNNSQQQEVEQDNSEQNENKSDIEVVGSWIYNDGESIIIVNADNTGKVLVNGSISEMTWQYNEPTKLLVMKTSDFTEEATFMDDGTLYVDGWSYNKTDDSVDINSYVSNTTDDNESINYTELTIAELEEYYDTTKFIGTPRVEEGFIATRHSNNTSVTIVDVAMIDHESAIEVDVPEGYSDVVYCIVVDNNTPEDISDDKIAHHWFELGN